MTKNMGAADRIIRVLLALFVLYLYFSNKISGLLAAVLGIFALVFLVTSFVAVCPLYVPLKLSTKKKQ
jgi:hypothetical protein